MYYFGSVKFYKHLILTVIILVLIVPYALSFYIAIQNSKLKDKLTYYQDNNNYFVSSYIQEHARIKNLINNDIASISNSEINSENLSLSENPTKNNSFDYQINYEDLYVERNEFVSIDKNDKVAYLTFDDGPSNVTWDILNILDNYEIKATFFVLYKDDEESIKIYKEIVKRDHALAIHSTSHDYKKIYNSVDDYLEDFNQLFNHLYSITGIKPNIFRFPGGSINTYNFNIYKQLNAEMLRRGFVFYDWNVSSNDAVYNSTKDSILNSVSEGLEDKNKAIVLMHDSEQKKDTAATLPEVIEIIKNKGYRFEKLDNSVYPITFSYTD